MTKLTEGERLTALSLMTFATAAGIAAGIMGFIYPMGYYGYWFHNTTNGIQAIEFKVSPSNSLQIETSNGVATINGIVSALSFGHVPSGTPFGGYMQYKGKPPGGVNAGAGRGLFASAIVAIIGAGAALLTLVPMRRILSENIRSSLFVVGGAGFLAVDGGAILGYLLNPEGTIFGGSQNGIQGITLGYTGSAPSITATATATSYIIEQSSGKITDIAFGSATNSTNQGAEMSISGQSLGIAFGASFGITAIALLIFPFYIIWKNDPEGAIASMR